MAPAGERQNNFAQMGHLCTKEERVFSLAFAQVPMKPRPIPICLATARRGHDHRALAVFPGMVDQPRSGHGPDRESAIAAALHRTCIFYADLEVEREVILAEARGADIVLLLDDITLRPVAA